MKKILLSISICIASATSIAQISITQSDMPQAGESFITTTAAVDISIDPSDTGPNHTWDFQNLQPLTSATDTFYSMSDISLIYQLLFSGANLAAKSGFTIAIDQLTLEVVYLIYKNSSAQFEQYGYAGTFDGIPVPIIYGANDVIYKFPLQYGDVDSSESDFALGLPGVGYVSQQRKRVNTVDGWGTVITPAGNFEALRITSVITDIDSVFIDTLNLGTNVTLKSYEYKWLATGSGAPVLQINAQDVLGLPVVSQVSYQDTALQTGMEIPEANQSFSFTFFPNPVSENLVLQTHSEIKPGLEMKVTDISGKCIIHCNIVQPVSFFDVSGLENGIYLLTVGSVSALQNQLLVVQR